MDVSSVATAIGTLIGAVGASWLAAGAAAKRQLPPESERKAARSDLAGIKDQMDRIEHDLRKLDDEVDHLKSARYVTTEEFQVYTQMDSDRRERIVDALAEMRGKLSAMDRDR